MVGWQAEKTPRNTTDQDRHLVERSSQKKWKSTGGDDFGRRYDTILVKQKKQVRLKLSFFFGVCVCVCVCVEDQVSLRGCPCKKILASHEISKFWCQRKGVPFIAKATVVD